ncbi:MAG: alpha/beta fold hydrolase [Cyanobacteria bacterium J06627_28]
MDKQNIESIYPLTALQQAFLWHSLQKSVQAGLLHVRCMLVGQLNEACFRQAWEIVISAHPALRTAVHWEGVKQPLQVVTRQVELPWTMLDWRDKESVDAKLDSGIEERLLEERLEDFLQAERDRGFDFTQSPISRVALIRLTERSYELVWTCHHLTLDGWSGALVLNQVVDTYEALLQGKSPAVSPVPTFQAYVRWQQQQDFAATKAFWQETLAGYEHPESRPFSQDAEGPLCTSSFVVTREQTATVNAFLRSHRLTLNTLMQGVCSLLLRGYSQTSDILFGATVSGRQCDLPGVDSIVGMLINVLPIRVSVSDSVAVLDWLQALQRQQMAVVPYAHAALGDIQQWCNLPGRLFDSLLVIENYPIHAASDESSLQLENLQSGMVSAYGLTVLVKPGESLALAAESAAVTTEVLTHLLAQFSELLSAIVETPQIKVAEILASGDFSSVSISAIQRRDDGDSGLTGSLLSNSSVSRDGSAAPMSTPRSPLELTLLKIWSSILGQRQQRLLGFTDSFFDWGGSSLLAVQLFNEMQRQLNCTLPLATLFQAPTVRAFAAILAQSQSADASVAKWSSLVPIQPNGDQRPFFFHGGSADALTWARFSQLLGADQPFYAFQRPDLDGREVTMLTVEELAATCVKELRMVQPEGPYIVGGHCFGGAVAFEMARQLQAQGQRVESVVLIDAYRPEVLPDSRRIRLQTQLNLSLFWLRKNYYYHGSRKDLQQLPAKLWKKVQRRFSTAAIPPPTKVSPVQNSVHLDSAHSDAETASVSEASEPVVVSPSYEVRYAQAIAANEWAAARYQATKYDGTLKLFRAKIQMLEWYFGPSLGWQVLVKDRLTNTVIPGFFGNLFNQSAAPILAEQVKAYLSTLPSASMPNPLLQSRLKS